MNNHKIHAEVLTVGDLSRRTGIPIKAVRDYTDHGLVNTLGRSPAGYRTYTSDALWCLQVITTLRGLGLPIAEIRELARPHPQPPGSRLVRPLAGSRERITARIAALQATLARIDADEREHHGELTGQRPLWHRRSSILTQRLTLTPGGGPTVGQISPTIIAKEPIP